MQAIINHSPSRFLILGSAAEIQTSSGKFGRLTTEVSLMTYSCERSPVNRPRMLLADAANTGWMLGSCAHVMPSVLHKDWLALAVGDIPQTNEPVEGLLALDLILSDSLRNEVVARHTADAAPEDDLLEALGVLEDDKGGLQGGLELGAQHNARGGHGVNVVDQSLVVHAAVNVLSDLNSRAEAIRKEAGGGGREIQQTLVSKEMHNLLPLGFFVPNFGIFSTPPANTKTFLCDAHLASSLAIKRSTRDANEITISF